MINEYKIFIIKKTVSPNDFVKVTSSWSGISKGKANSFFWINYKDRTNLDWWVRLAASCKTCFNAYGKRESLCITVGRILLIQHIIQCRNFPIRVSDLKKVTSWPSIEDDIKEKPTIGNWTSVGPTLVPYEFMSWTHLLCSSRPLAEIPITFTLRFWKSGARRATSPSSVVQTGVKSPGWENRMAYGAEWDKIQSERDVITQESPIHSWNLIGPAVVWASKSGAMLPRRRAGMS